jgi:His-Xaa-Ser repeat protein HxsA
MGGGFGFQNTPPPVSPPPAATLPGAGSNVYEAPSNKTYFPPPPKQQVPEAAPQQPAPLVTLPGNSDKFKRIVLQLQSALTIYGYYSGPINGQVGAETKAAISKFQEDWSLKVTGTVTPDLLNALKIVAN